MNATVTRSAAKNSAVKKTESDISGAEKPAIKSIKKAVEPKTVKALEKSEAPVKKRTTKAETESPGSTKISTAKVEQTKPQTSTHMSGNNANAGLADKIEQSVVLKVNEVATKTTKPTLPNDAPLTEEQLLQMGEADYMNPAQLAFFRERLQQLEKDLLKNAGETTEHLRETVLVPDPADRATIEEEHALELRTRDRERKLLKKVQQSLLSIDAGEYGWCEETGEPIGIPRLLARPTATLSLEAQQRRELKQKLYGD